VNLGKDLLSFLIDPKVFSIGVKGGVKSGQRAAQNSTTLAMLK
jgi:hypothetical protein